MSLYIVTGYGHWLRPLVQCQLKARASTNMKYTYVAPSDKISLIYSPSNFDHNFKV